MDKRDAEKIIKEFESGNPNDLVTRKQVIDVMTAMNVYTLIEITEEISRNILDNAVDNMRKI